MPKKSASPKRPSLDARLAFRLPETVANDWRKRAAAAGLSLSDWLRVQVDESQRTGMPTPRRRPARSSFIAVDPDLLRQIAAIGNNVNQLARKVNTSRPDPLDQLALQVELSGIRAELFGICEEVSPQRLRKASAEAEAGDAH